MNYYRYEDLNNIFSGVASKIVSDTDVGKGAYLPDQYQREILGYVDHYPGIYPDPNLIPLYVLGTDEVIEASYYGSQRSGSGRDPEPRMGRFIDRIESGDRLAFCTDGDDVYICKIANIDEDKEEVQDAYDRTLLKISEELGMDELIKRATSVDPLPSTRETTITQYRRDPRVIAFVRRRSKYICEMPGCDFEGFLKTNGKRFMETHHIIPLAEGGEDSIFNTVALCPNCHRMAHFARNRDEIAENLKLAVETKNRKFKIEIC